MISNFPFIGIKFYEKMDIFQIDTLFFSFAFLSIYLTETQPTLRLMTTLAAPMMMKWRRVRGERAVRMMKRATWPITSASWWKKDVLITFPPPFPLCFFSSKRATDTRIATLEIVFCYRDHLTTFTGTEELAYYLIQFLFCTINVLSGT